MDSRRWEEVVELYEKASEREPAARAAFLAEASRGDDELCREVLSLLDQNPTQAGLLESIALWSSAPPSSIGPYRILGLIGEGGMGAVYEAEQENPRRIVALKVVKTGLNVPAVLRRFEQEAQALGRLQHPGIAQIYEAGVARGRPYFAMERIRGRALLEYAVAHHLTTPQRLELMIKICEAAHHAHEHGIIHRDLKPGNILVDETGQPKILDFGVARVTGSDAHATRQTDLGELVGTLAYMSPEQVLADPLDLDPRSDVYTLGVVLYELLTGRLPYAIDRRVYEAVRTIREEDPAPLSDISRAYRGDLDTIVTKTLEKDKTRRYASAADLAADLRRCLSDRPILARPPSASYQVRKFASRHKRLAGAVIAVFAVLLAGIAATTAEAVRANRERDRAAAAERAAKQERDRALLAGQAAKAVNDFLQNDLLAQAGAGSQAGPNANPDPDLKVRTALDRAAARVAGKFVSQPSVEASIRLTIGKTYFDLGLFPQARQQMELALDLQRSALGPDHMDTLSTMRQLAGVYFMEAKYPPAEALLSKVLEVQLRLGRQDSPETLGVMNDLAELASFGKGDHQRAEALLTKVLEGQLRVLGEEHPDTLVTMNNLALEYSNRDKDAEAEQLYQRALPIMRRVLGNQHPSTLLAMNNLGAVYRFRGNYSRAEALLTEVVDVRRRILGGQHRDTLSSMNSLALVYAVEGKYAQAERLLTETIEGRRQVMGAEHPETLSTMATMGDLYRMQGRLGEAESWLQKTLEIQRRVLGLEHSRTRIVLMWLGNLKLRQAQYAEAESLLRQALKSVDTAGEISWRQSYAQSMLGASLAGAGRYAEAEPLLLAGYASLQQHQKSIPLENSSALDDAQHWIIQFYQDRGQQQKAAEWRQKIARP